MVRRALLAIVCWLFLLGIVVQVFLAGAGLFKLTDFTAHGALGWSLPFASLALPILAVIAEVDRTSKVLALAILILTFIQPELALARETNPVLAAFHPVNALLIFWFAWTLARRATSLALNQRRQLAAPSD
jgi:Family of unknown function (DUF6220)